MEAVANPGFWTRLAAAVAPAIPVVKTAVGAVVAVVGAPVVIAVAVVACVIVAGVLIYNHVTADTAVSDVVIPDVAVPDVAIPDVVVEDIALPIAPPVGRTYLYDGTLNPPTGLTDEELAALLAGGMAAALLALMLAQSGANAIPQTHANDRRNPEDHHGYEIYLENDLKLSQLSIGLRMRIRTRNNQRTTAIGLSLTYLRALIDGEWRAVTDNELSKITNNNEVMLLAGDVAKVGIANNRRLTHGRTRSSRATEQVNPWNRQVGVADKPIYEQKVITTALKGNAAARAWETGRVAMRKVGGHSMHRHQRPWASIGWS